MPGCDPNRAHPKDQAMSDTAFMIATAAVVAVGVALRLLLPRGGLAAPRGRAGQAAAGG